MSRSPERANVASSWLMTRLRESGTGFMWFLLGRTWSAVAVSPIPRLKTGKTFSTGMPVTVWDGSSSACARLINQSHGNHAPGSGLILWSRQTIVGTHQRFGENTRRSPVALHGEEDLERELPERLLNRHPLVHSGSWMA